MTLPNFLIFGAPKSGTTSVYFYIKQHPQVFMSPRKEPDYFILEERRKRTGAPLKKKIPKLPVETEEEYISLFKEATNERAIGEASIHYLVVPEAAARIKAKIPKVKLIAVLRNPVERAFSNYVHLIREGTETSKSFAEALAQEETRKRNNYGPFWQYKGNGFYYRHLKTYFDSFDSNQIKIFLYEDIQFRIKGVLMEIFKFLEIDENFIPNTMLKYNISGIPRSQTIHDFLNYPNLIKKTLKHLLPKEFRNKLIKQLTNLNLHKKPSFPEELRNKLIETYREDILQLQGLIKRDLSGWLTFNEN